MRTNSSTGVIMAEITAAAVKDLREQTGQGMMECKKALTETGGDIEAAKDLLRKKGLVKAEKKAERATAEGLVRVRASDDGAAATIVEVRCETDFCSRNDEFRAMVDKVADLAAANGEGELAATDEITRAVQECFEKIGENMSFGRAHTIKAARVGSYVHHNDKAGVIVGIDGDVDEETLRKLCHHIAFSDPMGITADDIPADLVEKEKSFAKQEAIDSGKPEEIAEKMVVGKVKKFLAANALMEQKFVHDEKMTVKEALGGANVTAFVRYSLG